jgi:hypothetical protein
MKKKVKFFAALIILGAAACTQQQKAPETGGQVQQSSKRVIHVQGHPHELLTKLHAEGKWEKPHPSPDITGSNANVDFADICIWAQEAVNEAWDVDSAALIVKWTDSKAASDSSRIWGYRWNRYTVYAGDTVQVTKYSVDMIRAIANSDPKLSVLMQNTGSMGYTIDGIGYNHRECTRVPIEFDLAGAVSDSGRIGFRYYYPPNTGMGQKYVPDHPQEDADKAIDVGMKTGIIEHPFNIIYGYPAYDYDHWLLKADRPNYYSWQSGWYDGYWAFYVKDKPDAKFDYSGKGVSSRVLGNGCVDGFVFNDFVSPSEDMSGDYKAPCVCP